MVHHWIQVRSVTHSHEDSSANVNYKCPEGQNCPYYVYLVHNLQNWILGAVKASQFVKLEAVNDITRTRIFTLLGSRLNLIL